MWTQTTIGTYKNGKDKIRIQDMSHGNYILWRNDEYEEDFNSLEELNNYLKQLGLEELYLPKIVEGDNQWHEFSGNEHYEKIFSRKKENGKIESVIVCKFSDGTYSVYSRETDYNCMECLIETSIEFAEEYNKNPENDLELDAYEIGTHGASGMDECHRDLKDEQEVLDILKEVYAIQK